MTMGPGAYDEETTMVMKRTKAHAVILIVIGGTKGEGFSIQSTPEVILKLPVLLRDIADQIDADTRRN